METVHASSPDAPSTLRGIDSHLPALRWALEQVPEGPVLEFGGGMHSTAAILEAGRELTTIEPDPKWRMWLRVQYGWANDTYDVYPEFAGEHLAQREWAVVLIDHHVDMQDEWGWLRDRAEALLVVRGWCGIALVHDWHIGKGHMEDVVRQYNYAAWFAPDDGSFNTALASDTIDVAAASIAGGLVYSSLEDAPKQFPN